MGIPFSQHKHINKQKIGSILPLCCAPLAFGRLCTGAKEIWCTGFAADNGGRSVKTISGALWLCSYTGAVLETRCPFVRIFVQKEKRVSHLADALGRRSVGTICVCIVLQTKAVQAPGVPWADHGKTEMTT